MLRSITLDVIGDHQLVCDGCEQRVESVLKRLPGVREVRARARNQRIEVLFDANVLETNALADHVREAGYETTIEAAG